MCLRQLSIPVIALTIVGCDQTVLTRVEPLPLDHDAGVVGDGSAPFDSGVGLDPDVDGPPESCTELGGHLCEPGQSCGEILSGVTDPGTCCEVPCTGGVTCADQGGSICPASQSCPQAFVAATDSARCCATACEASPPNGQRRILAPPPQGVYLGVAERRSGQVAAVENFIGRKSVIFWPYGGVNEGPVETAPDHTTAFNVERANEAWEAGYLILTGFEPHPENGFLVDDVLRGQYDEHFRRHAAGLRAFGKPVFFEVAREPNLVIAEWKGGYGPNGDQSLTWAIENGERTSGEFDPTVFPNAGLYAGLGDPDMDDGLERLVAMHRYLYDFYVNREALDFLTFGTMGWGIMGVDVPAEGFTPIQDFLKFYRLLADDTDWLTLNFYSYSYCAEANLTAIDAWIQAFRQEGINKPIILTELGFCTPNRASNITDIFIGFLRDYPEIAGFSLWMVDGCGLTEAWGLPELKAVIDAQPDRFHSCPVFADGSVSASCTSTPYVGFSGAQSCIEQCQLEGESAVECAELCGEAEQLMDTQQCLSHCQTYGDEGEECDNYCGVGGCSP